MEELKFEKLSEVPVIEKLTDNDFVMAVQDGEIVRISKNEVGSAEKRELLFDFNFSAEDETGEIMENISKQLSDLLMSPSTELEVELEVYGFGRDSETGENFVASDRIGFIKGKLNSAFAQNAPILGISMRSGEIIFDNPFPLLDIGGDLWIGAMIQIFSGMTISESGEPMPGDGGAFTVMTEIPIKSFKLYRIIK